MSLEDSWLAKVFWHVSTWYKLLDYASFDFQQEIMIMKTTIVNFMTFLRSQGKTMANIWKGLAF